MQKTHAMTAVAMLGICVFLLQADTVTVPNFSFESPDWGDGAGSLESTPIPFWTKTGDNRVMDSNDGQFSGTTGSGSLPSPADGEQYHLPIIRAVGESVLLTSAGWLTTAVAGETYTLTVAAGQRKKSPCVDEYEIRLLFNGSIVASTNLLASVIAADSFQDMTVSYTALADDAGAGITVQLAYTDADDNGSGFGCFDNVRLTTTAEEVVGTPIPVPNFSGELPDVADGLGSSPMNPINGWTKTSGDSRVFDPMNTQFSGTTGDNVQGVLPDGGQHFILLITVDGSTVLTSAASLTNAVVGATYILKVAVGQRKDTTADDECEIRILLDGSTVASATRLASTLFEDYFQDMTVSYTALPGDGGKAITVAIVYTDVDSNGGHVGTFDNVRLEYLPPPPGTAVIIR